MPVPAVYRRVGAVVVYVPTVILVMVWPGSTGAAASLGLGAMVLCAAIWIGYHQQVGAARRAWLFFGIGLTLWLLGDVLYIVAPATATTTGLSLPDLGWLPGYPAVAWGLLRMVRLRAPGQLREGLLDCLVMVTAALVAVWQFLVVPQTADVRFTLQVGVQAWYPLADMVIFGGIALLVLAPGRRGPATQMLLGGMYIQLVNDLIWDVLPRMYPHLPMERFDLLPATANLLFAGAALHPGNAELTSPGPAGRAHLHPARLVFLGVALLATPTVAVLHAGESALSRLILLAATAVIMGAVLARFAYAVREQEAAQRRLAHQASHDQLTGLVNRLEFTARLEAALAAGHRPAVLFVDLDGFKAVNDGHGHEAGDAVLVEVARRLTGTVRSGDLVARLGGDEFVVLCREVDLTGLAGRLAEAVSAPIPLAGTVVRVGASVGVATATSGTDTAHSLLSAADKAMYAVKRSRLIAPAERGRYAA